MKSRNTDLMKSGNTAPNMSDINHDTAEKSRIFVNLSHNPSAAARNRGHTEADSDCFKLCAVEEERLSRVRFYRDGTHTYYIYNNRPRMFKKPSGMRSLIYCLRECHRKGAEIRGAEMAPVHSAGAISHHDLHAASSFWFSGFEKAAVLTVDGSGRAGKPGLFETAAGYVVNRRGLKRLFTVMAPHSLGNYYFLCAVWAGLGENPEGKLMALASYGEEAHEKELYDLVELLPDGGFKFAEHVFSGAESGAAGLPAGLGDWIYQRYGPPVVPGRTGTPEDRQIRLARAVQGLLNYTVAHMSATLYRHSVCCESLHHEAGDMPLCMAGGVALNSVANRIAFNAAPWSDIFIQPAAYDGGLALGLMAAYDENREGIRESSAHALIGHIGGETGPLSLYSKRLRALENRLARYRTTGDEPNNDEPANDGPADGRLANGGPADDSPANDSPADGSPANGGSSAMLRRNSSLRRLVFGAARLGLLNNYADAIQLEKVGALDEAVETIEKVPQKPPGVDRLFWLEAVYDQKVALNLFRHAERLRRRISELCLSNGDMSGALQQYLLIEKILPGAAAREAGCLAKELHQWKLARRYLRLALCYGQFDQGKEEETRATLEYVNSLISNIPIASS